MTLALLVWRLDHVAVIAGLLVGLAIAGALHTGGFLIYREATIPRVPPPESGAGSGASVVEAVEYLQAASDGVTTGNALTWLLENQERFITGIPYSHFPGYVARALNVVDAIEARTLQAFRPDGGGYAVTLQYLSPLGKRVVRAAERTNVQADSPGGDDRREASTRG